MRDHRFTVCGAGYPPHLTGPYTPDTAPRLLREFGSELRILGASGWGGCLPRLSGVLLPAFVKAHGHRGAPMSGADLGYPPPARGENGP